MGRILKRKLTGDDLVGWHGVGKWDRRAQVPVGRKGQGLRRKTVGFGARLVEATKR